MPTVLPPPFLLQVAAAIKPYEVLFMEEIAVPGNLEVFRSPQSPNWNSDRDRRTPPYDLGVLAVPE